MNSLHPNAAHILLAEDEIARCQRIASARFQVEIDPIVHWDVRGLVSGYAMRSRPIIRLNPTIAAAEGEAFRQTVAHEYAHLVTFARERRLGRLLRPHGAEWAEAMLAFGREVRRCHQYQSATRVRTQQWFAYQCQGCAKQIPISSRRHAKVQRGTIYRHARCGGILKRFSEAA